MAFDETANREPEYLTPDESSRTKEAQSFFSFLPGNEIAAADL
jgi:hypothetical protein